MRIAHVITRLMLGGAQENTVLECGDLMREHGDNVLLVTGPPGEHEGDLLPWARAGGVPLQIVPELQRAIHPWRDAAAYRKIKARLRDFQPDVVHTHSAKAGILGRAAAWKLGVPAIVHTVHGAPFHPYQGRGARRVFRACERWAARRCHAMVSVADAMTDLLVEAGVAPRDKFTTVYSGMEVEPFLASAIHRRRVREELGYGSEHVVVGKVARLFHLKGHEYLIRAAGRVVKRRPNVRFLLVGSGILHDQLTRQIAEAGLTDYFRFAGLVPRDRMPEMLAAMDMVVHASLREGLARVLPQALLAGKPVVSYDIDGAREVVLPEVTGILLPPQSVEPLAEAIERLASDREMRVRLGEEGRRRCRDVFCHRRMTAQLRQLYARLLKSHARNASKAARSHRRERGRK
ncbi:MAG: glycosyltransferase family 4 protein [Pirellulales bacterium]|nr:glycosyltransferase family 4 protein [Pirellulales bacterium]